MFGIASRAVGTALAVGLTALVFASTGIAAEVTKEARASKGDRETFVLPEDRLSVTLGTPSGFGAGSDTGDAGDYAIWVGEVEINGRKTVWVELIDDHGEVIYDSEVAHNETHLLPDGRAVVVRALTDPDNETVHVAKTDQSRVAPDARLVVTRRVVDDPSLKTAIEFIEQTPREDVQPQREPTAMMKIAAFGEMVWERIVASLSAARDSVMVAWAWITQPFRA
ncbi:hypothetical protein H1W37_05145 [Stappia taiwanensis]|uniref:Uncharacterized protein n=1 Tax=Stappia taiwanensis TaxID=992267 RepID=A0A838XMH5_9HYPH|nr:hypothetical protein [Stappia taiwanensis]GGE93977.1 hypothetical protein GCM10007285_22020 [Stappia taiwanensis]